MTRIIRLPPTSVSIRIVFAPASSAFSSNSLTTEAGRSTTSPAAILFATASGKIRIRLISISPGSVFGNYSWSQTDFLTETIGLHPGTLRIGSQTQAIAMRHPQRVAAEVGHLDLT